MFSYSGGMVNLSDLKPEDVKLMDIAHSLSNACRYNGHCSRFYSVAEHSVRLARYAMLNLKTEDNYHIEMAKYLLMHDATETYVGDMIFHLKDRIPAFGTFEDSIAEVIHIRFDLPDMDNDMTAHAKHLDRAVCFDEMYILFGRIDPWFYENQVEPLGLEKLLLSPDDRFGWTPEQAKEKFLAFAATLGLTII